MSDYLSEPRSPININPAHKGEFTRWAREHGFRDVQTAARHVLANREHYPEHVVQMANFAHNATKFHHGGTRPVHHRHRDTRREESQRNEDIDEYGFDEDEETPSQERYERRHGGDPMDTEEGY